MIYASWLYNNSKCYHRCSYLLFILLWMATMFDTAMTTQGNKHEFLSEGNTNSYFCSRNRKSFLNFSASELEILSSLSSKRKPSSSSKDNYPSSRSSSLPQGSLSNVTFTSHYRMDSYSLEPYYPIAGCISLLNYYWRHNSTMIVNQENLLGVQIFVFHLDNKPNLNLSINLRILIDSIDNVTFLRPITIVLSSFLPRRISLSVMSYLSHTQQPIHILVTHFGSDISISDTNLNDSDMDRIFISVLDLSYDDVFRHGQTLADEIFLEEMRGKFLLTDLFKFGYFYGFRYNSISNDKSRELLWLFDNGIQYTTKIPEIKLVGIYMVYTNVNLIELLLNAPEEANNSLYNVFYQDQCTMVNDENYPVLHERIRTFERIPFLVDEARTCTYYVKPLSPSLSISRNYSTVTWLHFEPVTGAVVYIKLSSDRIIQNGEKHLVILTSKKMNLSSICIESFYLQKRVYILSNISQSQFDQSDRCRLNTRLISVVSMTGRGSNPWTNYISASSAAVMQTTIYKLRANKKFEIRVNVDDSQVYTYRDVFVRPECVCNTKTNGSLSFSIDSGIWKLINKWIPSEFYLGRRDRIFKRVNETHDAFSIDFKSCSRMTMESNQRIYGIWRNQSYLLYFSSKCRYRDFSNTKSSAKPNTKPYDHTELQQSATIVRSDYGFYIFNENRFINPVNKSFYDNDRIYIEIGPDIVSQGSGNMARIQLRDCYLTNERVSAQDLQSSTGILGVHKLIIVRGGCINQSSAIYSNIAMPRRPVNHSSLKFVLYKFSVGVDVRAWVSELSLETKWLHQSRIVVHLYCGVNRCYHDNASLLDRQRNISECKANTDCLDNFTTKQTYFYYGPIVIEKTENVPLKVSMLAILSIIITGLLICLLLFLWRLQRLRSRYKCCRAIAPGTLADGPHPEMCCDHHCYSLKLLDANERKPIAKEPSVQTPYPWPFCSSLQQLLVDTEKSIMLQANYLSTSLSPAEQRQYSSINNYLTEPRQLTHSVSEVDVSHKCIVDRALCSWPLSLTGRSHRRSYHSQPPPSSLRGNQQHVPYCYSFRSTKTRDGYRFTLINAVKNSDPKSLTYISNPKLSSNRTTMSGESASASDMLPNNNNNNGKSYKWWTPMSNCLINKSVVTSRI